MPVKTVAVAQSDISQTSVQPASIHAYFRAELRSQVSGYVSDIQVDIGDYVQAGAELAHIDVPEVRMQRKVLEARVGQLQAEELRTAAGVRLAAASIESAQAKLSHAQSQMARATAMLVAAEAEFARTEDLVQRESLQERMLDEARSKRDAQLAEKQAMSAAIEAAEAEVGIVQAQLQSAEAMLQADKAETQIALRQIEELDVQLSYAILQAPFAGVVTERHIEPGDLVRQQSEVGSGEPLFVISQVDKLRVRIPVPEVDAPLVNLGDEVSMSFPSFASEPPLLATVTRRSGSLDPSTRTMLVEADIDNPDGKLLPGMFGQATIRLGTKVAANTLPARSIRFDESGKAYVYMVGADETVRIRPLTLGIDNGTTIQILTGIDAGQRVIDAHLQRFAEGQAVKILDKL